MLRPDRTSIEMKTDEEIFRRLIREVCNNPDIDVFVDSNILLVGEQREVWASDGVNPLVTREIICEVRKRPRNLGANRFIDDRRKNSRVLSRDGCPCKHALDFVMACSMRIPPVVENAIREQIQIDGEPEDADGRFKLVNNVLQKVVNSDPSLFGTPEHRIEMKKRGIIPDVDISVSAPLKKAWFSYLPKRMKKKNEGAYMYTDEKLASIAMVNSTFASRPTVIVSSDYDYAAIFKQQLDNVIATWSKREDGSIDDSIFQSVVHSVEHDGRARELSSFARAFETGGSADAVAPKPGEVLVVIPRVSETLSYAFTDEMKDFVTKIENQFRADADFAEQFRELVEAGLDLG